MSNQREKDLWKEIDRFAFWTSLLAIIILTVAYFLIAGVWTGEAQLLNVTQIFLLNVIANLIPVLFLFASSYALFRRIQTLKAEREVEELSQQIAEKVATKVLQSLFEAASHNAAESSKSRKRELSAEEKFSVLIQRELEITNKFFDDTSTPQKIVIEFTNRGSKIFHITKMKFSSTQELPDSAIDTSYRTEGGGRYIIIPFENSRAEVSPGQQFLVELRLAQKWERNRINGLAGSWGYLRPDVIYDGKSVELFYSI